MASECKLCALLGATPCVILENSGNESEHADLHARQLQLIEFTIEEPRTVPNGSDTIARNNGQIPTERKPTKTVLSTFCRELANSYGKNCDLKCSQCKISIRSKLKSGTKSARSLINHACVHLNKDLYACSHCDFKFVSMSGICSHLKRIHGIRSYCENYVDMTGDHQNDMMDMVKLCFGKAPDKILDVTKFGQQQQNWKRGPLLKLAYDFMSKHQGGDIQCHLCPRSISSYHRGNATNRLLDHARLHLNKPIFTCHLCHYSSPTTNQILQHLKNSHRVASSKQNYKDESNEYYEEISGIFEDCFGETKKERLLVLGKYEMQARKMEKQLVTRCGTNSLLAERQIRCANLAKKFHRSGKLQCRLCRQQMTVVYAKGADYLSISIQHVLSHMNKPLISCRLCPYKCMTKTMILRHVRTKHGVSATNQYDDRTNDFQSDFMDMLSKCFDWDLEPSTSDGGSSQSSSGSQRGKLGFFSKNHGNDLKIARQVLALDLIKKHVKDGKVICRVCDRVRKGRDKRGFVVSAILFNHALTHLDSRCWPYCCKLCSYTAASRPKVESHLKNVHNHRGTGGFDDISDQFHEDIMKIVSKCYDWDLEPSTSAGFNQGSKRRNEMKTARRIFAHDLIRKHVKDGKIICQVCDQATNATRENGSIITALLFNHALTHLDKRCWPYRCTLCSRTGANRPNIVAHLKRAHKSGSANGFDDSLDRFHEDIMKIISKCYDCSIEVGEMA